jgi:phosphohistidine phosphatase
LLRQRRAANEIRGYNVTMRLYFLRHASAADVAPSDAERKLTKEGEAEACIAGRALAKLGVDPTRVFSSPLVRARQTVEIVARELKFSGHLVVLKELLNDAPTPALLKALKSYGDAQDLLLVGHMPSLAEHIATLIEARAESLPLGKGSIACVELEHWRIGTGQLRWLMRQKQLAEIAD